MKTFKVYTELTAEEAADLIKNDDFVGVSGFTYAGSPKNTLDAIAQKAGNEHKKGKKFAINMLSGASIGQKQADNLAENDAINWCAPYQTSKVFKEKINHEKIDYVDIHLSKVADLLLDGFFKKKLKWGIIEASELNSDGRIFLTTAVGNAPIIAQTAEKLIIEINKYHNPELYKMHDIAYLGKPPVGHVPPISNVYDKVGKNYIQVDPKKIIGVIKTNSPDTTGSGFNENAVADKIAQNVVGFLLDEMKNERIPKEFLPIQSGVGNINNAILDNMGANPDFPTFNMYTEVLQDSVIPLMEKGEIKYASSSSLTVSNEILKRIYSNISFFNEKITLRPSCISNNPSIIHELGIIALNVGIEVDIYGHVNSSHIGGTQIINGIGGSGDFARSGYLSIFMMPSVAKNGEISSVVPFASHIDHSEHSVSVIVTEQGVADIRGLSPKQKSETIINNCANPIYKDYLRKYLKDSKLGHIRHNLKSAFDLHERFSNNGSMK